MLKNLLFHKKVAFFLPLYVKEEITNKGLKKYNQMAH